MLTKVNWVSNSWVWRLDLVQLCEDNKGESNPCSLERMRTSDHSAFSHHFGHSTALYTRLLRIHLLSGIGWCELHSDVSLAFRTKSTLQLQKCLLRVHQSVALYKTAFTLGISIIFTGPFISWKYFIFFFFFSNMIILKINFFSLLSLLPFFFLWFSFVPFVFSNYFNSFLSCKDE